MKSWHYKSLCWKSSLSLMNGDRGIPHSPIAAPLRHVHLQQPYNPPTIVYNSLPYSYCSKYNVLDCTLCHDVLVKCIVAWTILLLDGWKYYCNSYRFCQFLCSWRKYDKLMNCIKNYVEICSYWDFGLHQEWWAGPEWIASAAHDSTAQYVWILMMSIIII